MIEKQVFFLDIIGRGEAFSKHRFQAGSRFFTTDTRHLKIEQSHAFQEVTKEQRP